MTNMEAKVFPIEVLREFCARVLMHFQVPESDAMQAADVLAAADLRGIDSHGVARMSSYVDLLGEGLINPKPQIKLVRSTPSTATDEGVVAVAAVHALLSSVRGRHADVDPESHWQGRR